MIIRQFYEKLGSYLYALAMIDGAIHKREEETIMNEILEILNEYPGFEANAEVKELLLTKLCFYNSGKETRKPAVICKDFLDFLELNKRNISDLSLGVALRLIKKTGKAYKGLSESEKCLIADVEKVLLRDQDSEFNKLRSS